MPVDQRLDQLAAVEFVVVVRIVHLKVVELQLLLSHLAGVQVGEVQMFAQVLLFVLQIFPVQDLAGLPVPVSMTVPLLLWNLLVMLLLWHLLLLLRDLLMVLRHLLLGHLLLRDLLLLVVLLRHLWRVLLRVAMRLLVALKYLVVKTGPAQR